MSKQTEALKLALEAFKQIDEAMPFPVAKLAQKAIREALAEQPAQQQEPVAWMDGYRNIYSLEEKAAGCVKATIALVPMANQEKTSGSPKPAKPEALRLAELFEVAANAAPEGDEGWLKTAAELRRMHDLLGKANALCRIRAEEIERLKAQPEQEPVAHSIVAGALFDFMGWLTSRNECLVLSSTDDAAPAADAIKDFAHMRNLSIDDAKVREWQEHLASPPASKPWAGLSNDEIYDMYNEPRSDAEMVEFARAIEAKLREKNA